MRVMVLRRLGREDHVRGIAALDLRSPEFRGDKLMLWSLRERKHSPVNGAAAGSMCLCLLGRGGWRDGQAGKQTLSYGTRRPGGPP